MILFCPPKLSNTLKGLWKTSEKNYYLKNIFLDTTEKSLGVPQERIFKRKQKHFIVTLWLIKAYFIAPKTEVFHYEFLTFTEKILNGKLHYLCSI